MLRQMIFTQWKWSRLELGIFAVLGFVIPTVVIKLLTGVSGVGPAAVSIGSLLNASTGTGVSLVTLAFVSAVSLSSRPWVTDSARSHVFALSLPVRWSEFVRLRFAAGAVLLLIPAAAVWFGGTLSVFTVPIPATLHVYPTSIAVRFYTSALVMYAAVFALQYLAGKRAAMVAAGFLIAVLAIELVAQSFGFGSVASRVWDVVTTWPGPFEVLTARWMLIDV